jgi:hypothetical protein
MTLRASELTHANGYQDSVTAKLGLVGGMASSGLEESLELINQGCLSMQPNKTGGVGITKQTCHCFIFPLPRTCSLVADKQTWLIPFRDHTLPFFQSLTSQSDLGRIFLGMCFSCRHCTTISKCNTAAWSDNLL